MSRFDPPHDHVPKSHSGCVPIVVLAATCWGGYAFYRLSHSIIIGVAAAVVIFLLLMVGIGWSNS